MSRYQRSWESPKGQEAFLEECIKKRKLHPEDIVPLWKEKFGFTRSFYSLERRCHIMNLSYEYILPKRKQVQTRKTAKKRVSEDVAKSRLQQKLREYETKYKVLVREKSLEERLITVIKDETKALPKVNIAWTSTARKVSHETAGLLFSDSHIGDKVVRDEVFSFGEYDFDVYVRRMKFLANSMKSIVVKKLKGYRVDKLCIFGLGDMVSGRIHEELIEVGENIVFQVLNGAYVAAQFILELSQMFKEIEIDGVVGNHGRIAQKKHFKHKYVNWDYMFYQMLAMFLAGNDRIKTNFPMSFFWVKKIYDWNFLMLHGDNIRSWFQIPWYGIERAMWKLGDLLQGKGVNIHYRVLGHFHRTGEIDRGPGEVMVNGSIIGGSEHSLGAMFEFDRPTQIFFGVHKDYGVTWRYPLRLDMPEADEVEPYAYNQELDAGKYMQELLKKKK